MTKGRPSPLPRNRCSYVTEPGESTCNMCNFGIPQIRIG